MGNMTRENADKVEAAIDDAHNTMSASDFAEWATHLLGFKQKGSKGKVKKAAMSYVRGLATSYSQTSRY